MTIGSILERFEPAVDGPATRAEEATVLAFADQRLLIGEAEGRAVLPTGRELEALAEAASATLQWHFLGRYRGREVYAVAIDDLDPDGLPDAWRLRGLRGVFGRLSDADFWLAARAVQIVAWDRNHRFCGRCGAATRARSRERSRICPRCELDHYPRLAPAVIVLVHDGPRVLLARSPHFPPGMFSTLAGFAEPGESLEHTVRREIHEEVGVAVDNLRYFGSQPWPFPHSLMVGFHAEWAGGEIRFDPADGEIEAADWFPIHDLPHIPPRISIARALIEAYRDMVGSEHR